MIENLSDALLALVLLLAAVLSVYYGYVERMRKRQKRDWVVVGWCLPWGVQAVVYGSLAVDWEWLECRPQAVTGIVMGMTFTLALMIIVHLVNGRVNTAVDRLLAKVSTLTWTHFN